MEKKTKVLERYPCPYCPAPFDTYEDLVAHIKTEHPGERRPGDCQSVKP